eukprot:m.313726 g.313726  ORF g.313726 m.313726 type:complete len:171 (-) comp23057_c3_seq15:5150-5662(-)
MQDFTQEAYIMSQLHHPNIVQLLGVCFEQEPLHLVMELMKNGSLLDYLHSQGRKVGLPALISMASQVAAGMAYLEEHKFIHRDVAARNILVGGGPDIVCKIGDFNLARKLNEDGEYVVLAATFPVKWTAPEAMLLGRLSVKVCGRFCTVKVEDSHPVSECSPMCGHSASF